MPFSSGDQLGTYVIVGPLGAGGMGAVYKAHDQAPAPAEMPKRGSVS